MSGGNFRVTRGVTILGVDYREGAVVRLTDEDRALIVDLLQAGQVVPADDMTRSRIHWRSRPQWGAAPEHLHRPEGIYRPGDW